MRWVTVEVERRRKRVREWKGRREERGEEVGCGEGGRGERGGGAAVVCF